MLITTAISLIIQFLPQILSATGVISPNISKLISDLGGAIPGLITSLATPGATVPDETITVLNGLRTELAALQADTTLDPAALQMISTLLESIDDALAAYEAAGKTDDPSTLQPLPTNL